MFPRHRVTSASLGARLLLFVHSERGAQWRLGWCHHCDHYCAECCPIFDQASLRAASECLLAHCQEQQRLPELINTTLVFISPATILRRPSQAHLSSDSDTQQQIDYLTCLQRAGEGGEWGVWRCCYNLVVLALFLVWFIFHSTITSDESIYVCVLCQSSRGRSVRGVEGKTFHLDSGFISTLLPWEVVTKKIHPSIYYLPLNPLQSSGRGGWNQSKQSTGEGGGTPWTVRQFSTGPHIEKHSHWHSHVWSV